MYRPKYRVRKTPHDVKPWYYTSRLKSHRFKSAVHALASIDRQAYYFIIKEFCDRTSLELIMSGLWKYHSNALKEMQNRGYGSLSPNSLYTFREKYWKTGRLSNPEKERAIKLLRRENLMAKFDGLNKMNKPIMEIQRRTAIPTDIGIKLFQKLAKCIDEIMVLNFQLGIYKPVATSRPR